MIASAPEPNDDGTIFFEPEKFIEEFFGSVAEIAAKVDQAGLLDFQPYDLETALDFREWEIVPGIETRYYQDGIVRVPASRIRVIQELDGKAVYACFEREDLPIEGKTHADIMRMANQPRRFRWRVTHRYYKFEECSCPNATLTHFYGELIHEKCGRVRAPKVQGPLGEHVASLHLGMPDDAFNGYYPSIPGNDIAHHNPYAQGMEQWQGGSVLYGQPETDLRTGEIIAPAEPIRGGTEIRNGRSEFKKKTKELIAWDKGTQAHLDRQKADVAAKKTEKRRDRLASHLAQAPSGFFKD